jgi:hypothetical protein
VLDEKVHSLPHGNRHRIMTLRCSHNVLLVEGL